MNQYFETVQNETWQEDVDAVIQQSAEFYRQHPGYQQLILSGKAPERIKRKDRRLDDLLLKGIHGPLNRKYALPDDPKLDEVFAFTLNIVELAFALSVIRDGCITEAAITEAQRAARAYLGTYIPEKLTLL